MTHRQAGLQPQIIMTKIYKKFNIWTVCIIFFNVFGIIFPCAIEIVKIRLKQTALRHWRMCRVE